ncbi:MAG: exodeoxyribonuclease VII small subunit [Coriobacteriia bacterium]|nr:exodeoxyribonuclease VII small subunit [Coriobacteriia bacterium]
MADERYNFAQARTRLEEIVTQVRKKDTSLEKSLDLLEEGVRLANTCTELSDHTEWRTVAEEQAVAGGEDTDTPPDALGGDQEVSDSEDENPDAQADGSPVSDDEAAPGE